MATTAKRTEDMSVKVGGRLFQPAFPVVDLSGPDDLQRGFQSTLAAYCQDNIPLESSEGLSTRERVLSKLRVICSEWIKTVAQQKGMPSDVVNHASGQLFTSGSYRLGVHEPGADIDTILVAPSYCRKTDFFGIVMEDEQRDPGSLAERIKSHPDVTNFNPVEGAAVPLLTFDWEGINIDLLFARINVNVISPNFDIDNDAVLDGADSATEKSINGPRVTNLIAALVSQNPQRYQTFLTGVRCIRKWAKARGLYSNKMGFWGGVNINIAVALVLQLYPNACPATLLRKFFLVCKTWRWPQPMMLTKPHDAGYGLQVWTREAALRQVAPMITPAYPAMNSTLAISRHTLQILQEEFNRGHDIVDKLWKDYQNDPKKDIDWSQLFQPSDFFISYPLYLSICIVGPSQEDAQAWAGFVESRLRKLVSDMLGRYLPVKKIQLWPKKLEACVADRGALLTQAQRRNSITYFIGYQIDKSRMRGDQLNIELPLQNFREFDLLRFQPLVPGMDVLVKSFKVKELPRICFEGFYEGGKKEAMKKRRRLRELDPVVQERRRLKKLEQLKEKMEEMKRKKEAAAASRKRSRATKEEDDEFADVEAQLKQEQEVDDDIEVTEETDLLDSVLDKINDDGEQKTREQAEADRQKLLSGELLTEATTEEEEYDEEDYVGDARQDLSNVLSRKKSRYDTWEDMRSLPPSDEAMTVLKSLGFEPVPDDKMEKILPPYAVTPSESPTAPPSKPSVDIKFLEPFDIVELDARGHVIDKGDADFTPCLKWQGRKAGFEFKLGERGLGYYRTGKKVVIPSNTAY